MSSLECCVEAEVLQNHHAQLNATVVNPDVFGSYLVQCGFSTQATVGGILNTLGLNNYQKANQLLQIVDSRIRTATSRESARDLFNQIVLIFANQLNRADIAEALVATYSESLTLQAS